MGDYLDGFGDSLWGCRYIILGGLVIVAVLVFLDIRNARAERRAEREYRERR